MRISHIIPVRGGFVRVAIESSAPTGGWGRNLPLGATIVIFYFLVPCVL